MKETEELLTVTYLKFNSGNNSVFFQLREMPADADFDLTDPYSPPPRYNVLHDPHLKEYFQNPAMRKRLVEKGGLLGRFIKSNLGHSAVLQNDRL